MIDNETLQMLQALAQGRTGRMQRAIDQRRGAAADLVSAYGQPVNRRLVNPGQGPMDVLGIGPEAQQTANQNRSLLQMGLGMMGPQQRGDTPGSQFSRGIQSGLNLLDELREGDRSRNIEEASVRYTTAGDTVADELGLMEQQAAMEQEANATYGTTERYIDEDGNMYFGVMRRQGGEEQTAWTPITPGAPDQPKGRVEPLGNRGLTAQQRIDEQARAGFQKTLRVNSAQNAQAAFEQFKQVRSTLGNINDALDALEQGAESGPISQYLPSFRESTRLLENAMNRMGLDVVGATTFGALSKGELDLALKINVDPGLQGEALKRELLDKRRAQVKLMDELMKAARFFEAGGLPGEYMEMLKERGLFEGPDITRNREIQELIDKYTEPQAQPGA